MAFHTSSDSKNGWDEVLAARLTIAALNVLVVVGSKLTGGGDLIE
jgi:hypothetical protein